MRRTLLILAISASLAVSGCSAMPGAGGGQPHVKGGLCEQNVAAAAQAKDDAAADGALDPAIRTCRTLAQWAAAVEAYGGDAVTPDASTYLGARCAEPTSGVGRYMLCGLLAESLTLPPADPQVEAQAQEDPETQPPPSLVLVVASPPPPVSPVAPVPPAGGAAGGSPLPTGAASAP